MMTDSFLPRIQSVFYAVFDVKQGSKIVYQVPEGLIGGLAPAVNGNSSLPSTPSSDTHTPPLSRPSCRLCWKLWKTIAASVPFSSWWISCPTGKSTGFPDNVVRTVGTYFQEGEMSFFRFEGVRRAALSESFGEDDLNIPAILLHQWLQG